MVSARWKRQLSGVFVLTLILFSGEQASALLNQTKSDLRVLEDRLRYEAENQKDFHQTVTPILVATPQAYWSESQMDFAPSVLETLSRAYTDPGDLISCSECLESRIFVSRDNRMVIQNGELSLSDLARLRAKSEFARAKSLLIVKETPAGISVKLVALNDGRLIYTGVADGTQTLDRVERPLKLARELDRRERGESLSYFHLDLGIYPTGLAQLKWLEQWGSRNQHLGGLAIGAFNPTGAVGATYQYLLPGTHRATLGLTAYYGLQGVFSAGSSDFSNNILGQASIGYALTGAFGLFLSGDTKGVISAGISLQNPVFLPFLF